MCIHVYAYAYTCMHIYIYIYIHTHIHMSGAVWQGLGLGFFSCCLSEGGMIRSETLIELKFLNSSISSLASH